MRKRLTSSGTVSQYKPSAGQERPVLCLFWKMEDIFWKIQII